MEPNDLVYKEGMELPTNNAGSPGWYAVLGTPGSTIVITLEPPPPTCQEAEAKEASSPTFTEKLERLGDGFIESTTFMLDPRVLRAVAVNSIKVKVFYKEQTANRLEGFKEEIGENCLMNKLSGDDCTQHNTTLTPIPLT